MTARPRRKDLTALFLKSEVASGTTIFGNQASLAEFLEVHRSQVTRAAQGTQELQNDPAWRLSALGAVYATLRHVLDEDVIPAWLHGTNAHLNFRRPIDLLQAGHVADVMAAVEAERSGSFA
jgi:hypothetical protein